MTSAALVLGALVIAAGPAVAASATVSEPPTTDCANLVFDLGALAGEHDVLADSCFPGLGLLDWPPLTDPWGATTTAT